MEIEVPKYVAQAINACTDLPTKHAKKVLRALGWEVKKKLASRRSWELVMETKKKVVVLMVPAYVKASE